MFLNLHLLRAAAALAVVYFHATSDAGLNFRTHVGAHGVDVFFVISGFIIAYVGARTPDRFLLRRIVRIVPAYWTATLAVFALAALAPRVLHSTRADVVHLLCSLLFIPRATTNGDVVPTLVLGWSLNYEMYFYGLFAVSLLITPRLAAPLCSVAIIAIALAIRASGITHASLQFYGRPLVFEFVYGVGAFVAFAAIERRAGWFVQRPGLRWALWFVSIAAALGLATEEAHGGFGLPRVLVAGVPAFVLVLSATLLERVYGVRAKSRAMQLLGESSYVLYLIHPYIIYGVLRSVLPRSAILAAPVAFALVIALMGLSTLVAASAHAYLEVPVIRALRRRLLPSVTHDAAAASAAMSAVAV
jgi:peptidoglycan/LPS O-acetylase OafA/YrhL